MFTFLQAEVAAVAVQPELEFSLIDMACKGGWLMIPLVLLSIATIYLFAMKWSVIRKAAKVDPSFMQEIEQLVMGGNKAQALELCKQSNTPIARMVEKGIERIGRPLQDIQTAVENTANIEVASIEKGLPLMATIAGGAPMIGFLGTVTGMIQAFFRMSTAGNNIDITLLSGGIYEAMVTTVGGLFVGIVAYFGYNFLSSQISNLVFKMESTTIAFIDMLHEPVEKE